MGNGHRYNFPGSRLLRQALEAIALGATVIGVGSIIIIVLLSLLVIFIAHNHWDSCDAVRGFKPSAHTQTDC